jgi:hypothetical protein
MKDPPKDALEKLILVFSEAKTELDSTVGAIDQLTVKAFALLSIAMPTIAILMVSCLLNFRLQSLLFYAALVCVVPLILCSITLVFVVLVVPMYHSGREPGDWFNPRVMSAPLDEIYADEIDNYGVYIKDNKKTLRWKSLGLKIGMGLFVVAPLLGLLLIGTAIILGVY